MPELTHEMIAEATAPAEKVGCRPGDQRCYPLPDPPEIARTSCGAQRAPAGAVSHRGHPKGHHGEERA